MVSFRHDRVSYVQYEGKDLPLVNSEEILTLCDWVSLMWFENFDHERPHDWGCANYKTKLALAKHELENAQTQYAEEKCLDNFQSLIAAIRKFACAEHDIDEEVTPHSEAWAKIGEMSYLTKYCKIKTGGSPINALSWTKVEQQKYFVSLSLKNTIFYRNHIQNLIDENKFPYGFDLKNEYHNEGVFFLLKSISEAYRLREIADKASVKINVIQAIKSGPTSSSEVIKILHDTAIRHGAFLATASTINTNTSS